MTDLAQYAAPALALAFAVGGGTLLYRAIKPRPDFAKPEPAREPAKPPVYYSVGYVLFRRDPVAGDVPAHIYTRPSSANRAARAFNAAAPK